jgi:hypothetical protein
METKSSKIVSGTLFDDRSMRGWLRLWRWVLIVSCLGMVVFILAVNWVLSGFHGLAHVFCCCGVALRQLIDIARRGAGFSENFVKT